MSINTISAIAAILISATSVAVSIRAMLLARRAEKDALAWAKMPRPLFLVDDEIEILMRSHRDDPSADSTYSS